MVTAADTEIDLAGLSLRSDTWIDGIVAFAPDPPGATSHRLIVRNGTISLHNRYENESGSSGQGVVVPYRANLIHGKVRNPDPLPARFPKVEYILENLTIKTSGEAALLMGDGIIIRNCTIEVEGENALVVYGPNAIIENNRITFRAREIDAHASTGLPSAVDEAPIGRSPKHRAAIYLRAADNAVVRGNTISIDERDEPVSGVAVIDSHNVLIKGNRFNTDVTPVTRHGSSSVTLMENDVKQGFLGKVTALPNMELR